MLLKKKVIKLFILTHLCYSISFFLPHCNLNLPLSLFGGGAGVGGTRVDNIQESQQQPYYFPKNLGCSLVSTKDRSQDHPRMPKFTDAQVPYIKCHRSMHTVPSHLQTLNCGRKTVLVTIEKTSHISGPAQFKPVLLKD